MYTRGRQLPQAAFPTVWCCKSCSLLTLPCPHWPPHWPGQAVLLPTFSMPGVAEKDCSHFPPASTPWHCEQGSTCPPARSHGSPPLTPSHVLTSPPWMLGSSMVQSSAPWEHHTILQRVKQFFDNLSSPKEQKHGQIILPLSFQHLCFGMGMGF